MRWTKTLSALFMYIFAVAVLGISANNVGAQDTTRAVQMVARIVSDDYEDFDGFGHSISIDQETVIVSAPNHHDTGSVYVFSLIGGEWMQTQKLIGNDTVAGGVFGHTVIHVDDTLIIGAVSNGMPGSVYVFTRTNQVWTQQQKITPEYTDPELTSFGSHLAFDGTTLLISAKQMAMPYSSMYFVYTNINGVWTRQQTFMLPEEDAYNWSYELVVKDDLIVIGGEAFDGIEKSTGSAFVFQRIAGIWTFQQKLLALDGKKDDYFGRSIVIVKDSIIIGAPRAGNTGAVYIYKYTNGMWELASKVVADSDLYGFGSSLQGFGNSVLMWLLSSDYPGLIVRQFDFTGDNLIARETFTPNTRADYQRFGLSVATFGDSIAIGAPGDSKVNRWGFVYIFMPTENLLTNGGFESIPAYGKAPRGWKGKNTKIWRKDKQKCDDFMNLTNGKQFSHKGDCAFLFKGNPTGERTKLNQKFSDLSPFTDGATLTLSVYVDKRSAKVGHPFGKLIVKYLNGDKEKVILRIPDAEGYTLVSDSLTINLNGSSLDVVKVSFRNRLTSGKFFIDDASLTVTPATALKQQREVLPMPDAPEGFRD